MRRATRCKIATLSLGLLLIAYVAGYLFLSLDGRYEPAAIGLNGVKQYQWAPCGFVQEFRWNRTAMIAFYPLFMLDRFFWHTPDEADTGRYLVNEVPAEQIWKVYAAWESR
jgi:hypothetical protein